MTMRRWRVSGERSKTSWCIIAAMKPVSKLNAKSRSTLRSFTTANDGIPSLESLACGICPGNAQQIDNPHGLPTGFNGNLHTLSAIGLHERPDRISRRGHDGLQHASSAGVFDTDMSRLDGHIQTTVVHTNLLP
jgi:hypothetical protein